MEVENIIVGNFKTNCYILSQNNQLLIIDPGAGYRNIDRHIQQYVDHKVVGILLTHGHFDHIGAVDRLVECHNCPVYIGKEDEVFLKDEHINSMGPYSCTLKTQCKLIDSEKIDIGTFHVDVMFTPGHTPGSVMYIIDGKLFSGDTVFRESIGRCDLYGGSFNQIQQSLKMLRYLPHDMEIYPGHENNTTVGHELMFNPFI